MDLPPRRQKTEIIRAPSDLVGGLTALARVSDSLRLARGQVCVIVYTSTFPKSRNKTVQSRYLVASVSRPHMRHTLKPHFSLTNGTTPE
jgi:uncharacterized protein (DUF2141 family)